MVVHNNNLSDVRKRTLEPWGFYSHPLTAITGYGSRIATQYSFLRDTDTKGGGKTSVWLPQIDHLVLVCGKVCCNCLPDVWKVSNYINCASCFVMWNPRKMTCNCLLPLQVLIWTLFLNHEVQMCKLIYALQSYVPLNFVQDW